MLKSEMDWIKTEPGVGLMNVFSTPGQGGED